MTDTDKILQKLDELSSDVKSLKGMSNSCRKDKQPHRKILNSFERGKPDCRKGRNFFKKQASGGGSSSQVLPKPLARSLMSSRPSVWISGPCMRMLPHSTMNSTRRKKS